MSLKSKTIRALAILQIGVITIGAEINIFAASSLSDAMKALAEKYSDKEEVAIRFNFSSSGTLARQIESGAPADIFISANIQWMNWMESRHLILANSRMNLAGNKLVMIAPKGSPLTFNGQVPGRIAVGELNSVPAGMYAKEALEYMGWLEDLKSKIVMGSNARTVLMYVERGEADAGIVYDSDAKSSAKIMTVGVFPDNVHRPIIYPAAACSTHAEALNFLDFLKTEEAKEILRKLGFSELQEVHD